MDVQELEPWTRYGTLHFIDTEILGPPLLESGDAQSASTFHQVLRLASVKLTVPRTRNGSCACRLVGVGGDVRDRDA